MSLIIYFFNGISLIWYLISPKHRHQTNTRWKLTRPHKLVYEIGTGIIGIIILITFLIMLIAKLIQ